MVMKLCYPLVASRVGFARKICSTEIILEDSTYGAPKLVKHFGQSTDEVIRKVHQTGGAPLIKGKIRDALALRSWTEFPQRERVLGNSKWKVFEESQPQPKRTSLGVAGNPGSMVWMG